MHVLRTPFSRISLDFPLSVIASLYEEFSGHFRPSHFPKDERQAKQRLSLIIQGKSRESPCIACLSSFANSYKQAGKAEGNTRETCPQHMHFPPVSPGGKITHARSVEGQLLVTLRRSGICQVSANDLPNPIESDSSGACSTNFPDSSKEEGLYRVHT